MVVGEGLVGQEIRDFRYKGGERAGERACRQRLTVATGFRGQQGIDTQLPGTEPQLRGPTSPTGPLSSATSSVTSRVQTVWSPWASVTVTVVSVGGKAGLAQSREVSLRSPTKWRL